MEINATKPQNVNSGEEMECISRLYIPGISTRSSTVGELSMKKMDSVSVSPCESDGASLTCRRLREMIPCTPSPMYGYDSRINGFFGEESLTYPRFFPFGVSDTQSYQPHAIPSSTDETDEDEEAKRHDLGVSHAPSVDVHGNGHQGSITSVDGEVPTPLGLAFAGRSTSSLYTTSVASARRRAMDDSTPQSSQTAPPSPPPPPAPFGLLDRVRESKPPGCLAPSDYSMAEVVAECLELARDQVGSRFLQLVLESATAEQRHEVFLCILPHTERLTTDAFGNYVVQKLIDLLPPSHGVLLGEQLGGHVVRLARHMFGCRVVQRVMDAVPLRQQIVLAREVQGHVVACIEDQNGNHVIQKCIECLPPAQLDFVLRELEGNVERMARHCYGCRVVQRLLERLPPTQSEGLVAETLASLWPLAQDQFGNYVVQHVLQFGTPAQRAQVVSLVEQRVVDFACHKFASNVAEKALSCGDQATRDRIILAVLGSGGADAPLHLLMRDRFANYVIQRCLDFSHGSARVRMLAILQASLPMLKRVIYGKHIATAVERLLGPEGGPTRAVSAAGPPTTSQRRLPPRQHTSPFP